MEDLARAKGVHATYVSRILRLTLLAPEIVEAILDGRQPAELQLDDLLEAFPLEWDGSAQMAGDRWAFKSRGLIMRNGPAIPSTQNRGEADDPARSHGAEVGPTRADLRSTSYPNATSRSITDTVPP